MAKSLSLTFFKKHKIAIILAIFLVVIFIAVLLIRVYKSITHEMHSAVPTSSMRMTKNHPKPFPTTNPAVITSSLFFVKNNGSVTIAINTGSNEINGIQIGVAYDPKSLTNVKITPTGFFPNPVILQNLINQKTGIIHFALALQPGVTQIKGQGIVATLTYTIIPGAKPSKLSFTRRTKITSNGINASVLKNTTAMQLP